MLFKAFTRAKKFLQKRIFRIVMMKMKKRDSFQNLIAILTGLAFGKMNFVAMLVTIPLQTQMGLGSLFSVTNKI